MPIQIESTKITDILHPIYADSFLDWYKWRLAYIGGRYFINNYLKPFSILEDTEDFQNRKLYMTPPPAYAKCAINDVRNTIFSRMSEVTRLGGTESYMDACAGKSLGVDLQGSSMTYFLGMKVLQELLVMKKVGIYVDMPNASLLTKADVRSKNMHPYLYVYVAEDIRSWTLDFSETPNELSSLLIREQRYKLDKYTNFPTDTEYIYKRFWLEDNRVFIQHYTADNVPTGPTPESDNVDPIVIEMTKIPFVILELSSSLMNDIADYQVALLNMSSADIAYCIRANVPLYTEQFDPRSQSPYLKDNGQTEEVKVGQSSGRRYPVGTERPGFINPSAEPIRVSMEKQEQMKEDIRLLTNLAIKNLQPRPGSRTPKTGGDDLGTGLAYIGLELEHAEQQIGKIWSLYEKTKDFPVIKYPERYDLKSDEDRRKDAESIEKLIPSIPSSTFQREMNKCLANALLHGRVSDETMDQIEKEIEESPVTYVPPNILVRDLEQGLVSTQTASTIRGYPPGEVDQAKQDHADRLSRIAIAQSEGAAAARGVGDQSSRQSGSPEKTATQGSDAKTQMETPTELTRGQAE